MRLDRLALPERSGGSIPPLRDDRPDGSTPISTSRVAYWQGRAAEAEGRTEDAERFYAAAAEKPTTYYGQLATTKLAQPVALRQVEPLLADERAAFDARTPVRALKLLAQTAGIGIAAWPL